MNDECQRIADRLASYSDGTMPAAERAELDQHLGACAGCRTTAAVERTARSVLRARAADLRAEALPPGLRSRCEAIAREATAPAASWRARLVPAALAALLILITGTAVFYLASTRSTTVLAAEATADHDRCFRNFVTADSPDLDAPAVEADLAERFGWRIHVPPSSDAAGVHLVHARRCLLGRASHILYRAEGQNLSLYVLQGENHGDEDITQFGHHARIWTRGTTTFVLVSAADGGDLTPAVRYVMQEAR